VTNPALHSPAVRRSYQELPQMAPVGGRCFSRHEFELFVEMGEVVEPALVADGSYAGVVSRKQVASVGDAVFIQKCGKGLVGHFFEKAAKCRGGNVHGGRHLVYQKLPVEMVLHKIVDGPHALLLLRLYLYGIVINIQGVAFGGVGHPLEDTQQFEQPVEAFQLHHFLKSLTHFPPGLAAETDAGFCAFKQLLHCVQLRGSQKIGAEEIFFHLHHHLLMLFVQPLCKTHVRHMWAKEYQVSIVEIADVTGDVPLPAAVRNPYDFVFRVAVPVGEVRAVFAREPPAGERIAEGGLYFFENGFHTVWCFVMID
jgi:hypothetical protein